jgi:hypothetical protein
MIKRGDAALAFVFWLPNVDACRIEEVRITTRVRRRRNVYVVIGSGLIAANETEASRNHEQYPASMCHGYGFHKFPWCTFSRARTRLVLCRGHSHIITLYISQYSSCLTVILIFSNSTMRYRTIKLLLNSCSTSNSRRLLTDGVVQLDQAVCELRGGHQF